MTDDQDRAGVLDAGDIASGDTTLRDVTTEREGTALSPDEAAIHVVDDGTAP